MSHVTTDEREQALRRLADALRRRGLAGAALLLARGLSSLNIVISHGLLVAQPLVPHARWRRGLGMYADLLEDQESWQTLIEHLEASDS